MVESGIMGEWHGCIIDILYFLHLGWIPASGCRIAPRKGFILKQDVKNLYINDYRIKTAQAGADLVDLFVSHVCNVLMLSMEMGNRKLMTLA